MSNEVSIKTETDIRHPFTGEVLLRGGSVLSYTPEPMTDYTIIADAMMSVLNAAINGELPPARRRPQLE